MKNIKDLKEEIKEVIEVDDVDFPTKRQLIAINLQTLEVRNICEGDICEVFAFQYSMNNLCFIPHASKDADDQIDDFFEGIREIIVFDKENDQTLETFGELFIVGGGESRPDYVYSKEDFRGVVFRSELVNEEVRKLDLF